MSKKDLIIICIIAGLFSIIGGAIGYFIGYKSVVIPLPDNSKYIRHIDSLNVLNRADKDSIVVFKKVMRINDSLSLLNIKKLSHDKKLIDNFTPITRKRALDSIFALQGI